MIGILLFLFGILLSSCAETPQKRTLGAPSSAGTKSRFARKDCLDCHKKFSDKYLTMKNIHAVVKEKKCEDCHLRHGLIGKLILKKDGNEIC